MVEMVRRLQPAPGDGLLDLDPDSKWTQPYPDWSDWCSLGGIPEIYGIDLDDDAIDGRRLLLGFSRGVSFGERLKSATIRWFTGGTVSHAFLLYNDSHLGWLTIGANSNGVTYQPLEQFKRARLIVKLFEPVEETMSLWTGLARMRDFIDAGFNLSGLIGMSMVEIATHWLHQTAPRNWLSDPHRVFCSQMCVTILRHSGFDLLPGRDPDTIDPSTLMAAVIADPHFREAPIP
jgi:hypothetical protein